MSVNAAPVVRYEWTLDGCPPLSLVRNGRRLTIRPGQVRVVLDRSGWCVYIEGLTIKANGDYGQHRRVHWFDENPPTWSEGASLADLPGWAEKYLAYAQADRARAGVVAEEPEWEYGWHTGSTVSLIGRREQIDEWLMVRGWKLGEGDWGSRIMQRTAAGPWVPVKQEGADDVRA